MPDIPAALKARLASGPRTVLSRALTVDTTVRRVTLGPGGWRLRGASTQVYMAVRVALTAAGALESGEAAPSSAALSASAAGTPGAGLAWAAGDADKEASGSTFGGQLLPTDPAEWIEIAVPQGGFLNVYLRVAAGTANPVLEGPFA